MWFRKSCFCRQNVKWNAQGSYRFSRLVRKRGGDLVERVAGEAASSETSHKRRSEALALEQTARAIELGLEAGDRDGGRLGRNQAPPEIGADGSVAVAAPREQLCAALREPSVVEKPGAIERCEGVLARSRRVPRARQALLEGPLGLVARRKRSGRRGEGLRSSQLARELPRRRAVEASSQREPCPHDRVGGQDAPHLTVEVDGDPATLPYA